MRPTFSIVMPLYNKRLFVKAAIESVLDQSYGEWELIIVNDGSTDGSEEVISSYRDQRVRLFSQRNSGVSVARNFGIAQSRGEFIAFLDADDIYESRYLLEIVELICTFPTAHLFCSGYKRIFNDGSARNSLRKRALLEKRAMVKDFYGEWLRSSFTYTSAIVVRRDVLLKEGVCFAVGENLGEDQDLWFRLAERYSVAHVNEPLVQYRMDVAASLTASNANRAFLPCYARLGERLRKRALPQELVASARKLLASHLLNVANARLQALDIPGAMEVLADRRTNANIRYKIRTLLAVQAVRLYSCLKGRSIRET